MITSRSAAGDEATSPANNQPTKTSGYAAMSDDEQARALRPVAAAAAEAFGLAVADLELVLHAFNTTFAVHTTSGERFALRVNTNSLSGEAEILAQQAWQLALAEQTPVRVATPLRTLDGQWWASVPASVLGRPVLVTCASWLDGPDVEDTTPRIAHELGIAMAHLHEQATGWQLPAGGRMPRFDAPLFGDSDALSGAPLDEAGHQVLHTALERTTASFTTAYAGQPVIALHADLHGGNLKWHQGQLAIFDFDDSGVGVPALDLAVSTFYLRKGPTEAEQALRDGYASIRPLPDLDPADFEALIAARQILLLNSILATTTTQFRDMLDTYLPKAIGRLRHWLDTGQFTLQTPTD